MMLMRLSIICFAFGIWWLQQQASLPESTALAVLCGAIAALSLASLLSPRLRLLFPVAAFLFGFAWAGAMGLLRLADELPLDDEGRDIRVVGVVSGLPSRFENGMRFDFSVEQAETKLPAHISLAWYRGWRREAEEESPGALEVHAGERWQLTVRLKRPHGNFNPDGFDFEAWLLEAGIRATGVVRPAPDNFRRDAFVASAGSVVARLREDIRARFVAGLPDAPYAGILVALAVGDQQAIDAEQWQLFSRTGITHLMSISGLHVTMFASLAYALVSWLWRRSSALMLRLPAQKAAVIGGFIAALGYCLLAGYAVPAQRTLYMLGVVALALLTHRLTSASRVLALALVLVLLIDPWAVLAAGFWLSFGAVGVLFYIGSGRLGSGHWLHEWARAQWAVTLGMIPALLLLFQQFSLVSPLANAIAIPVVSFVVTPLALLAAALPQAGFLLALAHLVTRWLMALMIWLAGFPWAVWQQHAPPSWAMLLALAGCAWCLLPRGFPARALGAMLMLPMVLVPPARPLPGEVWVTTLDVGQGLAMHVQTAAHDLLFDTGPMYSLEANSGNRIIVPYLRARGVRRLDGLVVTHQDKDHSGGAEAVLDALPVGWLMSSLAFEHDLSAYPVEALPCTDGLIWEWDGVRFSIIHPLAAQYDAVQKKTNDMSCVLRVASVHGSALLTSDIEAVSERALLDRYRAALKSDLLIVPHHGSRTSSTPGFIGAVSAPVVIFPVGYHNRFHHPNAQVFERYRASAATTFRTDLDGAMSAAFSPAGLQIRSERAQRPRYWHGR